MILLPSTRQRIARVPLLFRAHDCLDEQGLFALSYGQKVYAEFTRTGPATGLDQAGAHYRVPQGRPRFMRVPVGAQYAPALLLEGAGVNLVLHTDALTVANGWAKDGAIGLAEGWGPFAGRFFTLINGFAGVGGVSRAVTFTGDGVKAFSLLVRAHNVGNLGICYFGIYDGTSAVYRGLIEVTVGAGNEISAVAVVGALDGPVIRHRDGVFEISARTTTVTAANSHLVLPVVDATSGATLDSILVSGVQVEDAPVSSSRMPATGTAGTRGAESCRFPYRGRPRAARFFVNGVELRNPSVAEASPRGVLSISDNNGDPRLLLFREAAVQGYSMVHDPAAATSTAGVGTGTQRRDTVELLGDLGADGACTLSAAIAGGVPVADGPSAAQALGAQWYSPHCYLNSTGASNPGNFAYRAAAVAEPGTSREELQDLCEVAA